MKLSGRGRSLSCGHGRLRLPKGRWQSPSPWLSLVLVASVCCMAKAARTQYSATEAMIPMRDGVKLYTQIFKPLGLAEDRPILMTRTPYSVPPLAQTLANPGPSRLFSEAGYLFVYQDVRGQFRSEGEWEVLMPSRQDPSDPAAVDESTDAYDTVEWLLENVEGHNGRVGMWGISYDGWQTVMAMADAHPALVAVSPQASPADMFLGDDLHHNGAFRLSYTFGWMAFMAVRRGEADPALIGPILNPGTSPDCYGFFLGEGTLPELGGKYFGKVQGWQDFMAHGNYDEFWERRNNLRVLDDVRPAVLHVAGWFDAEDFRGPIDLYHRVEENDDADQNFLVVGPWRHGGWSERTGDDGASLGDLDFDEPTSEQFRDQIEFPFFEHHLRDESDPLLPEVMAFETGGNRWHELDEWPPESEELRPLFLRREGIASFEPPAPGEGFTPFTSDPANPVPYTRRAPVMPEPGYMVEDQRFVSDRDDVLTFLTEPLEEDLVIAGRVEVELTFATTGSDADWIVKLIDVSPPGSEVSAATGSPMNGTQTILAGEIFRAKFRDSFSEPSPLEPGKKTELKFFLPDRFHRFRAGHRILVQVHSTWFPLYDVNPQTFTDIYSASKDQFQVADHQVFHEEGAESLLRLPVCAVDDF